MAGGRRALGAAGSGRPLARCRAGRGMARLQLGAEGRAPGPPPASSRGKRRRLPSAAALRAGHGTLELPRGIASGRWRAGRPAEHEGLQLALPGHARALLPLPRAPDSDAMADHPPSGRLHCGAAALRAGSGCWAAQGRGGCDDGRHGCCSAPWATAERCASLSSPCLPASPAALPVADLLAPAIEPWPNWSWDPCPRPCPASPAPPSARSEPPAQRSAQLCSAGRWRCWLACP